MNRPRPHSCQTFYGIRADSASARRPQIRWIGPACAFERMPGEINQDFRTCSTGRPERTPLAHVMTDTPINCEVTADVRRSKLLPSGACPFWWSEINFRRVCVNRFDPPSPRSAQCRPKITGDHRPIAELSYDIPVVARTFNIYVPSLLVERRTLCVRRTRAALHACDSRVYLQYVTIYLQSQCVCVSVEYL